MERVLINFEDFLSNELAENTVLSYMGDVSRFLNEMNITTKKQFSSVAEEDLEKYLELLKNKGHSYASICRVVSSLKKFYRFCVDEKILKNNITTKLETTGQKRKLPNTLTLEEVEKLLEIPDVTTIKGIRDKAMLEIMYATGCKVSEIINLRISDVSINNEFIMLSQGKKKRMVPIGRMAVDAVVNYLRQSRDKIPSADKSDVLFLNFYGKPLSRQGYWKIVKYYIEKCGIVGNITPQTIRHCFALHLLANGADIESVSEMLGHSDIASTKIYYDVMNDKMKQVYRKAHPRA